MSRSLALIVIGTLMMAGVLVIVLARFVSMPAVSPSSTRPSSFERPAAHEDEAHEWTGLPHPDHAR